MQTMFDLKIRNFPRPAKVMVCGFLFSLSLAYVYAILNIAMVIGWTPRDIAVHYYGSEKRISPANVKPLAEGEQDFNLDSPEPPVQEVDLGPRPSFKSLVQEGHFHLFGMTSFFFGLTLLGLFLGISERWKMILCGTPYLSIALDNLSFMATRFLGPHFAYLTALSGSLMGLSFVALWYLILREIYLGNDTQFTPTQRP